MRTASFLTPIITATLFASAGCGGTTAPEDSPAGPSTIVWTARASGDGGARTTTRWAGAALTGGCVQGAQFQAHADGTSTTPTSNIMFVAASPLADWPRLGSFQLSDSAGAIGVRVFVNYAVTAYAPDGAAPGTLIVDTYDPNTQILTGTFQFESIANAGGQYQAASVAGSFNFPCLN